MNTFEPLKLNEPGVAYGVISGFPVHDSYPVEDREKLDELFREDYFAWKAMSLAAISRLKTKRSDADARIDLYPFSHYRVNGWWEYKGRSPPEIFKAIVPASCALSKEQAWIAN